MLRVGVEEELEIEPDPFLQLIVPIRDALTQLPGEGGGQPIRRPAVYGAGGCACTLARSSMIIDINRSTYIQFKDLVLNILYN